MAGFQPLIGSTVEADRDALIRGDLTEALRTLLVVRGILVFRDLAITTEEQRAMTATFGPLQGDGGDGTLQKVTIDREESPEYAAYFANTLFWHMDGYHAQTMPVFGGSFRPARLAPSGGETEFLSAYAAYDGLSESDKRLADGLFVYHSATTSGLSGTPDASDAQLAAWRQRPPALQPLVWEHDDGRKSLMLGVAVSHVKDMHPADSYDLLGRLRVHINNPDYVYRHDWRENDLVLWNNTGTMHRARPFDPQCGRLLNRFTIMGTETIRAPGAVLTA